ncbi:hypothetical protein Rsub_06509 [Raphidocelis subcapitata]|uniref:SET domain-containing protein n=1 Tax=Raphidocelis subcapitata TaxID=307507 RepID=A0A2V0P3S9_9CHLO|nr:hypothetical protein Rsub_06509 [Raphidocelis subcapitata]|eukprot:GBF94239.1 hypothetical protein Rsub_06509 [Raphidocelis subcapitata]
MASGRHDRGLRQALLLPAAVALLLAACAPRPAHALFGGGKKSPEAAMIEWLKSKGGEINAEITARNGGPRGTYATRAVPADGILAKIPMSAAIWFPAEYENFADLGARIAREVAKGAASDYAPYLDALPMARDPLHTISYESWPLEYVHLIQSDLMSRHISSTQEGTINYWAKNGVALLEDGVTLDLLKAALVTIATRYFGITHKGVSASVMIPLLDFANHYNDCTNYYEYRACDYRDDEPNRDDGRWDADKVGRDQLCCFWRAGANVTAGQELCNRYGYMAPDQAFFQYNFIMPDKPPKLSRVDEAHFSNDYIYGALAHAEPREFTGHVEALKEEMDRVASRIVALTAAAKAEAATPAAPSDRGGAVLRGLGALRLQRLDALETELTRLAGRVIEMEQEAASAAAPARPRGARGGGKPKAGGGGGEGAGEVEGSGRGSGDGAGEL